MRMKKCAECGNYTLKDICPCGGQTVTPAPPRFSPDDKYWKERLKARGVIK